MFLLNFSESKLCLHLLILHQLICTSLFLLGFALDFTTALTMYTTMPVTTRSQTKASRRSFLYTGLPNIPISSSVTPTVESSDVYATTSSLLPILSSTTLTSDALLKQSISANHSVDTLSLDFQTLQDNFEISNSLPFDSDLACETSITHHSSHNFSTSKISKMEADCEDLSDTKPGPGSSSPVDIEKLFSIFTLQITNQITTQTNLLRDELRDNELCMVQDIETFQTEMREEISELRSLLHASQSQSSSGVSSNANPSMPSVPILSTSLPGINSSSSSPILPVPQVSVSNSSSPSTTDLQSQMMLLMAESFSKLSTVLVENKAESKSD
jgi:hypothetical protein